MVKIDSREGSGTRQKAFELIESVRRLMRESGGSISVEYNKGPDVSRLSVTLFHDAVDPGSIKEHEVPEVEAEHPLLETSEEEVPSED